MDEIVYAYYDKTFGDISNEEMTTVMNILEKFKPIEREV
jgi:hypothetical protein